MPKAKNILSKEIQTKPLTYIVQVVGVVVLLLNLWLASKLAPLTQDLLVLTQQVRANTAAMENFVEEDTILIQYSNIEKRLDRLETKLDTYLGH